MRRHLKEHHAYTNFRLDHATFESYCEVESTTCVFCARPIGPGSKSLANHVGRHLEKISFVVLAKQHSEWIFYEDSESVAAGSLTSSNDSELEKQLLGAAQDGDADRVLRVLGRGVDINATIRDAPSEYYGYTPLHIAASCGYHALVWLLLQQSADFEKKIRGAGRRGWTALHLACHKGHGPIVKLLLHVGAAPGQGPNAKKSRIASPFEMAVKAGHKSAVAEILQVSTSVMLDTMFSPLSVTARRGDADMTAQLLENNDLHFESDDIAQAVNIAANERREVILKLLLEKHGAILRKEHLATAVFQAAQLGHFTIVEMLLKYGAKVSRHAWHGALQHKQQGIIQLFLSRDVPVAPSAIHDALIYVGEDLAVTLTKRMTTNSKTRSPVLTEASSGEYTNIADLLQEDDDSDIIDALDLAAKAGNLEIVELLLQGGALPSGKTLVGASGSGNIRIVRNLLEKGISASSEALVAASQGGHDGTVKILLQNIVEPSDRALVEASTGGFVEVITTLIQHGLRPSDSVLLAASTSGHYVPKQTEEEVLRAVEDGGESLFELLLKSGAPISKARNGKDTILHTAAANCCSRIVRMLLEKGLDVNAEGLYGENALHRAAQANSVEIARLLLSHGATVNGTNGAKIRTPLAYANEEVSKVLKEHGAVRYNYGHNGWEEVG
jgi:ankyrin repeat protein